MALTQEDIAVIGQVIERQITTRINQSDARIREEVNQAFTATGEAFEMRLMQVIEAEREMFFEALRQIMGQVTRLTAWVNDLTASAQTEVPAQEAVAPEDVDDDAFNMVDDRVPVEVPASASAPHTPPTKGVVQSEPVREPQAIIPSVFGDGR